MAVDTNSSITISGRVKDRNANMYDIIYFYIFSVVLT
jgi:hypothetical protein